MIDVILFVITLALIQLCCGISDISVLERQSRALNRILLCPLVVLPVNLYALAWGTLLHIASTESIAASAISGTVTSYTSHTAHLMGLSEKWRHERVYYASLLGSTLCALNYLLSKVN